MKAWSHAAACDAFGRAATPALASPAARERLAGVADGFGSSIAWWLAERHLASDRVDVAMSFEQGRSAANLGAAMTADPALWARWPHASAVVRAWTDLGDDLHGATQISFEIDRAPASDGVPFPFVSMEPTGGAPVPRARAATLAASFLRACGAVDAVPRAHRLLADLPASCRPLHLGWLEARGIRRQRWVLAVPKEQLAASLRALTWPGDADPVAALATGLGTWSPWISVHIDVDDVVREPIGLGWFYPGTRATDRRWEPLFRWIRDRGLADDDALVAAGEWPGEGPSERRLLEIKVAWDSAGQTVAKAYCAIRATR